MLAILAYRPSVACGSSAAMTGSPCGAAFVQMMPEAPHGTYSMDPRRVRLEDSSLARVLLACALIRHV